MARVSSSFDRERTRLRLTLYIVAPFILLCLPLEWFVDGGESICLSVRLLGRECYGCGMTRALLAITKGEFALAWSYNSRAFIVAALLAAEYTKRLILTYRAYIG